MGIWSGKYKELSKQTSQCMKRSISLKPCDVGLEAKIKTQLAARFMRVPVLARFFYRHFRLALWIADISFVAVLAYLFFIVV